MHYVNAPVLSAVDTASQNGVQIDSHQYKNVSFHAYFGDATAAGTLKVQASNDLCFDGYQANTAFTVTNWVDIPNASAAIASGAPALITLVNAPYRWLRVVYTRSGGGSTTITVNMLASFY